MRSIRKRSLITDEPIRRYLAAFRKDFARRTESSRKVDFFGQEIVINPGVFPSDSPYSFSTQSILKSVIADTESGELSNRVHSICDVGTGCGVFLCVLRTFFERARLVGLEI